MIPTHSHSMGIRMPLSQFLARKLLFTTLLHRLPPLLFEVAGLERFDVNELILLSWLVALLESSPARKTTWLRATLLLDDELVLREKVLVCFPPRKVVAFLFLEMPRLAMRATERLLPSCEKKLVLGLASPEAEVNLGLLEESLFSLKPKLLPRLLPSMLLWRKNDVCNTERNICK